MSAGVDADDADDAGYGDDNRVAAGVRIMTAITNITAVANTNTNNRHWREVLKVHPAAEMFPLMSDSELRELADDIKKNGLREPITVNVNHKRRECILLDGRNRMDAMELLNFQLFDDEGRLKGWCPGAYPLSVCAMSTKTDTPAAVAAFVISKNIHRRHLTGEQKRDLIAKLLKLNPEKSNNAIAKTAGVNDKTVGAVRNKLVATSEIPKLSKTVGADGKSRPARKTSKAKTTTPATTIASDDPASTSKPESRPEARKVNVEKIVDKATLSIARWFEAARAISAELMAAAEALGMVDPELVFLAVMCNNPDGDRFIYEQTGARVGTMRTGAPL